MIPVNLFFFLDFRILLFLMLHTLPSPGFVILALEKNTVWMQGATAILHYYPSGLHTGQSPTPRGFGNV